MKSGAKRTMWEDIGELFLTIDFMRKVLRKVSTVLSNLCKLKERIKLSPKHVILYEVNE